MSRFFIITSVSLLIVIGSLAFFASYQRLMNTLGFGHRRSFNIVLLTRDAPFADQVTEGIYEEIGKFSNVDYAIRLFYARGADKLFMQSLTEQAIAEKPDLIISMGVSLSQVAINVMRKRGSMIPFIFAGNGDAVGHGLVTSNLSRKEAVTGVSIHRADYRQPADLLLKVKPSVRSVLLPYFPSSLGGATEGNVELLKMLLEQRNIMVYTLPLYQMSEVHEKVPSFMSKIDTIMCVEGDCIDEENAVLVKLCNQHGVTLFAKEIEPVRDGAAIGFATYMRSVGVKVMQYANQILLHGVAAGSLPIHYVDGGRILVLNKTAAVQQGLEVTPKLLALVDKVYE